MWWLSQSTRRLEAKWELSASEKHVPTSCLSNALRGIHALNSDVLPGASTKLFYQCSGIPKGNRKCLKYLGGGVIMYTLPIRKTSLPHSSQKLHSFEMQAMNIHVCRDRNLSTQFKEDPYKTECLASLSRSLQYADCALIQPKDFWQNKTYTACSYPNRNSKWITMRYWEPLKHHIYTAG